MVSLSLIVISIIQNAKTININKTLIIYFYFKAVEPRIEYFRVTTEIKMANEC